MVKPSLVKTFFSWITQRKIEFVYKPQHNLFLSNSQRDIHLLNHNITQWNYYRLKSKICLLERLSAGEIYCMKVEVKCTIRGLRGSSSENKRLKFSLPWIQNANFNLVKLFCRRQIGQSYSNGSNLDGG